MGKKLKKAKSRKPNGKLKKSTAPPKVVTQIIDHTGSTDKDEENKVATKTVDEIKTHVVTETAKPILKNFQFNTSRKTIHDTDYLIPIKYISKANGLPVANVEPPPSIHFKNETVESFGGLDELTKKTKVYIYETLPKEMSPYIAFQLNDFVRHAHATATTTNNIINTHTPKTHNNEEHDAEIDLNCFLINNILKNPFNLSIEMALQLLCEFLKLLLFQNDSFAFIILDHLLTPTITPLNDCTTGHVYQPEIRSRYCDMYGIPHQNPLIQTPEVFLEIIRKINHFPNSYSNDLSEDSKKKLIEKLNQWLIFQYIQNDDLKILLIKDEEYNFVFDFLQTFELHLNFIFNDLLKYSLMVQSSFNSNGETNLLFINILSCISNNFNNKSLMNVEDQAVDNNFNKRLELFNNYLNTNFQFKFDLISFLAQYPKDKLYSTLAFPVVIKKNNKNHKNINNRRTSIGDDTEDQIQKENGDISDEAVDHELDEEEANQKDPQNKKSFQKILQEEDVYSLHQSILQLLFAKTGQTNVPYMSKITNILITLADPKTQPIPTDSSIISIDYLTDILLGSVWSFYFNNNLNKDMQTNTNDILKISMLLVNIIKSTLNLLNLSEEFYLKNISDERDDTTIDANSEDIDQTTMSDSMFEVDSYWPKHYKEFFPCELDLRTLEILYMINILCTFTIFKLSKTLERKHKFSWKISPFATFFIKTWCFQTYQIHQGMLIDQFEESNMSFSTPDIVKAVIRGATAWRCAIALLINSNETDITRDTQLQETYYDTVKHDYVHESLNNFMSPHGRKLSKGCLNIHAFKYELLIEIYTTGRFLFDVSTPFKDALININLREGTEKLNKFFPWPIVFNDRFDDEAKYMFDWEFDIYNDVPQDLTLPEGETTVESSENALHDIKRCDCVINIEEDESSEEEDENAEEEGDQSHAKDISKHDAGTAEESRVTADLRLARMPLRNNNVPSGFVFLKGAVLDWSALKTKWVNWATKGFNDTQKSYDEYLLNLDYFQRHLQYEDLAKEYAEFRISLKMTFESTIYVIFTILSAQGPEAEFVSKVLIKLFRDPLNITILYDMCSLYTMDNFSFLDFVFSLLLGDTEEIKTDQEVEKSSESSAKKDPILGMEQCFKCFNNILLQAVQLHANEHSKGGKNEDLKKNAVACNKIAVSIIEFLEVVEKRENSNMHKMFSEFIQPYTNQTPADPSSPSYIKKSKEVENFLCALFSFQYQLLDCLDSKDIKYLTLFYWTNVRLLNNPEWDQVVQDNYLNHKQEQTKQVKVDNGPQEGKKVVQDHCLTKNEHEDDFLSDLQMSLASLVVNKSDYAYYCYSTNIFSPDPTFYKDRTIDPTKYIFKEGIKPLEYKLSYSLKSLFPST